jgi:hypothetical protein
MGAETAAVVVRILCDSVKLRQQLEAEILVLRRQLNVPQQRTPRRRLRLRRVDRGFVHLALPALPGHS